MSMNIPLVETNLAQSSLAEQQMRMVQRQAEASSKADSGAVSAAKEKKLRQACEGFESIFIQKMWESMRSSLPKEGMMHSKEEQFWQGMYDQELSKSLASAGGIGLADMMMTQLSQKLQSASEVAARRSYRIPMSIAPAPILTSPNAAKSTPLESAEKKTPEKTASMYDGEAKQPEAVASPTPPTITPPVAPIAASTPEVSQDSVTGALKEFAQASQGTPVSFVNVYKAGQNPSKNLDDLAATLAAQAAANGGVVHITTTRQKH